MAVYIHAFKQVTSAG